MRRFFIFLFVILLSLNMGFAYKAYNSSNSDILLKSNGWCAGFPVSFKVYNKTEYNLKKSDFSNICVGNQTVKHDHCITIQKLVPNVKVYSGPFDSMPIIFNGKADVNGTFNLTFNNSGPHLIEVTGLAKFNDYVDPKFNIISCKGYTFSKIENKTNSSKIIFFNQSYSIGKIKINLTNTLINSSSNISINENLNVSKLNLANLNNSFNIFNVNFTSNNFSNFKISIPIKFENKSNVKLNYYNLSTKKWDNFSNFSIPNSILIFQSSNLGYYGIVELKLSNKNASIIKNKNISTSINNLSNSTSPLLNSNNNLNSKLPIIPIKKPSKTKYYVLGGVLFLVIIFVIFFLYTKNKQSSNKKAILPDTSNKVEILNSYEQIYSHTKEYVKFYSSNYTKDQIYRSLKTANVPKDIIDKVFKEELD